jgi:transposase
MPRSLNVRKPLTSEIRRLHAALEAGLAVRQRRRAEVLLLYATGMEGMQIAQALSVHPNTVYSDLRSFAQHGVACLDHLGVGGVPARITQAQRAEILRLAEVPPTEVGLPYGRWSLAKLRQYLITTRVVKAISREHLRRVLKKGGSICVVSSEN